MKASFIVHLPGLDKTGNISSMHHMVSNLGMSMQNIFGENTRANDNLYQISTTQSLGITEKNMIKNCKVVAEKMIEKERLARKYLGKRGKDFEDKLARCLGTFLYAKKISEEEALMLLSEIKLGVDLGLIQELTDKQVRKLQVCLKAGNMQKMLGESLGKQDLEYQRPEVIQMIKNEK